MSVIGVYIANVYLNTYTFDVICVFARSVVGHDFKLNMLSYTIFNVSIVIDIGFNTCWHLV